MGSTATVRDLPGAPVGRSLTLTATGTPVSRSSAMATRSRVRDELGHVVAVLEHGPLVDGARDAPQRVLQLAQLVEPLLIMDKVATSVPCSGTTRLVCLRMRKQTSRWCWEGPA